MTTVECQARSILLPPSPSVLEQQTLKAQKTPSGSHTFSNAPLFAIAELFLLMKVPLQRPQVTSTAIGHSEALPHKVLDPPLWWLAHRKPLKKALPGLPQHTKATSQSTHSVVGPGRQHLESPKATSTVLRCASRSQKCAWAASSSSANFRIGKLEVVEAERKVALPVVPACTTTLI